jgi:hypothetical protein
MASSSGKEGKERNSNSQIIEVATEKEEEGSACEF